MRNQKTPSSMKRFGKKLAVRAAEHYANVSCPLVVYQPKMTESVKRLRKF